MIDGSQMDCCGVREMSGLRDSSKETIQELCSEMDDDRGYNNKWPRFRYAIFSDIQSGDRGTSLAQFIRRHKLGNVISTRWNVNPNSGNNLKVWLWTLDSRGLIRWWKEHKADDFNRD